MLKIINTVDNVNLIQTFSSYYVNKMKSFTPLLEVCRKFYLPFMTIYMDNMKIGLDRDVANDHII